MEESTQKRHAIMATSILALVAAGCAMQPVEATSEGITITPVPIIVAAPPPYGGNFVVHALGHTPRTLGSPAKR